MNEIYEYSGLIVVVAWLASRYFARKVDVRQAVIRGFIFSVLFAATQYLWPYFALSTAIFSPVSLGIVLLCAADLARPFGGLARRWSRPELWALLAIYVAYIYASIGGSYFDPYALGYGAKGAGAVAVALGLYALVRRDVLLGGIVLGSQIAWLGNIGSENFFDHITSALLIPAILIGLRRRAKGC